MVFVDWLKVIQLQVPQWKRKKRMVVWLMVCINEVKQLHAAFLAYRKASLYSLRITGQTVYLEKALNDRFDFVNRLIWIETATDGDQFYLYNTIELAAPVYFYNGYNPAHPYLVGEYALHGTRKWKALVASPAQEPGVDPAEWHDDGPRPYMRNSTESLVLYDFIIWVPAGLVFDQDEMGALVATYKLAGKRYSIQTY